MPESAAGGRDSQGRTRLELYAYAFDAAGQMVDYFARAATIEGDPSRRDSFLFAGTCHVVPGKYRVRVYVRNAVDGRFGFAAVSVDVPEFGAAHGELRLKIVARRHARLEQHVRDYRRLGRVDVAVRVHPEQTEPLALPPAEGGDAGDGEACGMLGVLQRDGTVLVVGGPAAPSLAELYVDLGRLPAKATAGEPLRILGEDADANEREVLSTFRYQENLAVLHRDPSFMPTRRRAWSSWPSPSPRSPR